MSDENLYFLHLLEDVRFTKIKEREYAAKLLALTPGLEAQYANWLRSWEPLLGQTEYAAAQWAEALLYAPWTTAPYAPEAQETMDRLIRYAQEQTEAFTGQLEVLQAFHPAIQANPAAGQLIRHLVQSTLPEQLTDPSEASLTGQTSPNSSLRRDSENLTTWSDALPAPNQPPVERPQPQPAQPAASPVPVGKHTLPPLPYAYNALEPYIDETTMRIHHDKHHQSYVDGLNNAENKLAEARRSGDFSLVKHWERELAFHGAGHYLHTLFWSIMAPNAGGPATGPAAEQIRADFGSFEDFKKQFSEAADKVEGGGWAIWVWSPRSQRTEILTAEKHQNLSQWDVVPLLALDVWEHAYYLKHQNKRADYIKDWWNVVNWKEVNERLTAARRLKWQPY